MRIDVLTLFPDVFDNLNSFSIIKKAIDSKKVEVNTHNLRDYADNSRKVDDYPYGGFPGMVIKIEPIDNCIEYLKKILVIHTLFKILILGKNNILKQAIQVIPRSTN